MLQNFFSDIIVSVHGLDGFEKFKNNSFDIIFTDINMPVMNGLEMIKSIRIINKNIPIVIFSAHDEVEYFLRSIKYGIDGYILKPFNYDQVEETLYKIVSNIVDVKKSANIINLKNSFYWDIDSERLYKNKQHIILTKSESALFRLLSSKYKTTYSTIDIEFAVFDDDICDSRRVRNLLSRLKRKVECELIESIYGEGYRFKI
jgi:YesN/AraC family two-component response regulator